MRRGILILTLLVTRVCAAEPNFPITPPAEDEPAPASVAPQSLGFVILDYGHPGVFGRSTNFWISSAGRVHTQAFKRRKDGKQDEIRYEYALAPEQLAKLQDLLNSLRKDNRVLRERYGHPDEFAPTIAFGMRPHSDLYIREKWGSDLWMNFTLVTRFLSEVHEEKTGATQPTYKGTWDVGQAIWEPEGYVALKVIAGLGYIGSDGYNTVLDANNKSEQGGSGQPATRSKSDSEGGDKPLPESEGSSR